MTLNGRNVTLAEIRKKFYGAHQQDLNEDRPTAFLLVPLAHYTVRPSDLVAATEVRRLLQDVIASSNMSGNCFFSDGYNHIN